MNNEQTTHTFIQKGETAIAANGADPKTLTALTSKILEKDAQEKEVIAKGRNLITEKATEKLELSEFSKRHSGFYRKEIAQNIRKLRFQYQTKLREKPEEIESLRLSVEKDQSIIEETKIQKMSDKESHKKLVEQKNEIESEIKELKAGLEKRKNSFLYKIQERFIPNKLSQENFEILRSSGMTKDNIKHKLYQKDFEIFENIQKKEDDSEGLKASLETAEKKLQEKSALLEQLKTSVEQKYQQINEAEEIVNSDSELKEAEKTLSDFYSAMKTEKDQLDKEGKERSVAEISREKNVLFCHSISLDVIKDTAFSQNNRLVKTNEFGPEEKIKMLLGVEPTISVSTINEQNQKLANNFGVILKEGQVLSSYAGDAGTLVAEGVHGRRSKYDSSLQYSNIQKGINDRLDAVINHTQTSSTEDMSQGWNELVVENPQVAGLFFQKDTEGDSFISPKAKKISKSLGLPLYVLEKDKMFLYNEETDTVQEVNKESILDSNKTFSNEEKKNLIEEMIDKEAFYVKRENIGNFNGYAEGKAYYKLMKRTDAGEAAEIRQLNDGEPVESGDEVVQLLSTRYVIKKNNIPEEGWKGWVKEKYEKSGRYFREKEEYEKKSENDNAYIFNPLITENLFYMSREFVMDGDNTASYIKMWENNFDALDKKHDELKVKNGGSNVPFDQKALLFNLFGFAEECKNAHDQKNYEKAMNLINKYGSATECETFIKKRVGQDGRYNYLVEDAPLDVRKKLNELSVSDSSSL